MRRILHYLLISLFLLTGTGVTMARDRDDRDRSHKEYRHDRKKHDKRHDRGDFGDKYKHGDKHGDKHYGRPGKGNSHARPGGNFNRHHRPTPPPPPPPPRPGYGHHGWHPNLANMVSYAVRGGSDVDVWQIDYDTYIVRFRKGKRYYTRRLYANTGRYGALNSINVNWTPASPWIQIPPIQLNINF